MAFSEVALRAREAVGWVQQCRNLSPVCRERQWLLAEEASFLHYITHIYLRRLRLRVEDPRQTASAKNIAAVVKF